MLSQHDRISKIQFEAEVEATEKAVAQKPAAEDEYYSPSKAASSLIKFPDLTHGKLVELEYHINQFAFKQRTSSVDCK